MNNKTIDILAVNAVRDSIAICDYLEPYIEDNDKTPSWDGEIMIYDVANTPKSSFKGKFPVQVKGTCRDNLSKPQIKHPVNVIDLKNYLRDGGVMYFVVYISEDAQQKKIYYNDLHLVKLNYLIRKAKGKSIQVTFKEFPESDNEKRLLCLSFCNTRNKQHSFKDNIIRLDQLPSKPYTLYTSSYLAPEIRNDPFKAILDSDTAWVVQFEGDTLQIPIDTISAKGELVIQYKKDCKVKVGERIFYDQVSVRRFYDRVEIRIGQSLKLSYSQNRTLSVHYILTNSLRNRITDANFIIAAILAKGFDLDGCFYKIPENVFADFKIGKLRKHLRLLQDYVEVLNRLHISEDLDLSTLTRSDIDGFNALVLAFIKNQPIQDLPPKQPLVSCISIGKLKIGICIEPSKAEKSNYYIRNLFAYEGEFLYKDEHGKSWPTSPYSILKSPEDYNDISNIDFTTLPNTYKVLAEENPNIADIATNDMLIMLSAYDQSPNTQFLTAIKELAEWILENKTDLPREYKLINLLQVAKRERDLNRDERDKLYNLLETDYSEDIKTAAALLLGDQLCAERHFGRMEPYNQECFKQFPIYHFWSNIT